MLMIEQESSQENTTNDKKNRELEQKISKFSPYANILIIFGVCFVFVTFIFNVILTPIGISGISMQPTINASYTDYSQKYDAVYYVKSNNYTPHDIVIIKNDDEHIIKRVVATAGETVSISRVAGTEVYSNNTPAFVEKVQVTISITDKNGNTRESKNYKELNTTFVFISEYNLDTLGDFDHYKQIDAALKAGLTFNYTVPDNTVYCLGDNRNHSDDSRLYGAFKLSQIQGELVLHVPHGRTLFYAIWQAITK